MIDFGIDSPLSWIQRGMAKIELVLFLIAPEEAERLEGKQTLTPLPYSSCARR